MGRGRALCKAIQGAFHPVLLTASHYIHFTGEDPETQGG